MTEDLFLSPLSRAELADLYVDTVTAVTGFPPRDADTLGRAALVDRIERICESARARRQAQPA